MLAALDNEPLSPAPILEGAAAHFAQSLAAIDRQLRRAGITVPGPAVRARVLEAFTQLLTALTEAEAAGPVPEPAIRRLRDTVGRWLSRSLIWNRALTKPHGYAGDFRIIEWLYDLENDSCAAPDQPGIVNCLDELSRSVDSIVALWDRRRWYTELLRREHRRRGGRLRILDVAGGGARYLRDFFETTPPGPGLELTVVDQDPAAIAFCRRQSLADWPKVVRLEACPIARLASVLSDAPFDLVICAGLFDYLTDASARGLLTRLAARLAPDGTIAVTNYSPEDRTRLVMTWLVDWPLIYRSADAFARLFPPELQVSTTLSPNGALVMATATGRQTAH
jgi:extracellular factor (EF) 3-hydroxypalmitic acid methyl ester biosynthesis protein